MGYIFLWIFALFGIWSIIFNIINEIDNSNNSNRIEVNFKITDQEDIIYDLVNKLTKIESISKIRIFNSNASDGVEKIIKQIQKSNSKIILENDT